MTKSVSLVERSRAIINRFDGHCKDADSCAQFHNTLERIQQQDLAESLALVGSFNGQSS